MGTEPNWDLSHRFDDKMGMEDGWMVLGPPLKVLLAYLSLLLLHPKLPLGITIVEVAMNRQNSSELLLNPL